ncbi:91_t:CDS:2, partial [Racocetra persica]
ANEVLSAMAALAFCLLCLSCSLQELHLANVTVLFPRCFVNSTADLVFLQREQNLLSSVLTMIFWLTAKIVDCGIEMPHYIAAMLFRNSAIFAVNYYTTGIIFSKTHDGH